MKVCNIKISLRFENEFFTKMKTNEKYIQKICEWTITQYRHSPYHINITGIKSKDEIEKAIHHLEVKFSNTCVSYQIDSVMISHKDFKLIKMEDVAKHLKSVSDRFYIDYHPELFTGMYLKPYDREFPTVNLFYTGSFQLLGGKSFKKIDYSVKMVKTLIEKCENGLSHF